MKAVLVVLALVLWPSLARSSDLDPDGALAGWLDASVGPSLAATLARHPRFAGERVDFVALVDGTPVTRSDRLRAAIQGQLRRHLLRTDGVRLALTDAGDHCATGPGPGYLIGIEVSPRGSRGVQVTIGLIDVTEEIWVGGVSYDWRGALDADERRALATPVIAEASGSANRPLDAIDTDAIARVLHERLRCALPGGLEGRVAVSAMGEDSDEARIASALRARLVSAGGLLIAPDRTPADWRLAVMGTATDGAAATLREYRVLLLDGQDGATQQLASVFVGGVPAPDGRTPVGRTPDGRTPDGRTPVGRTPDSQAAQEIADARADRDAAIAASTRGTLLGMPSLTVVDRSGICRRQGRDTLCAELAVELKRDGYLVVVSTRDGAVAPLSCAARPERRDAGERRFRFAVAEAPPQRPDTGIYLFAVRDRALARRLADLVQGAPGACGRDPGPSHHFLRQLADLLSRYPDEIDWRAVHLVRDADRVVRL